MYKVKNISAINGTMLQKEVKEWIESRDHIHILSVNIWGGDVRNFATIIYREEQYIG